MLDRLKSTLVDSFIGAIAIGWMLAESVTHLASALAMPLSFWLQERLRQQQIMGALGPGATPPASHFPFQMAIPLLITAAVELIVAVLLLRWLYWPARETAAPEPLE